MYIYIYIWFNMYICTYIYMVQYVYIYIWFNMYVYIYIYICIHMVQYVYIYIYGSICIYVYIYIYIWFSIYMYSEAWAHRNSEWVHLGRYDAEWKGPTMRGPPVPLRLSCWTQFGYPDHVAVAHSKNRNTKWVARSVSGNMGTKVCPLCLILSHTHVGSSSQGWSPRLQGNTTIVKWCVETPVS